MERTLVFALIGLILGLVGYRLVSGTWVGPLQVPHMLTVTRVVAIPTNRIDATGVIVFALQFRHTSVNAAIKRAKDASAIIHVRNVPMRILIVGYPDTSKIHLKLRREKLRGSLVSSPHPQLTRECD